MEIKIIGNLVLYLSKNRLIGYAIMYFSFVYALYYAMFIEGAAGGFGDFISLPAYIVVFGVGVGFTHMRKHSLKTNELGAALRKDFVLAGWIGFMIRIILLGVGMKSDEGRLLNNLGPGFATAILPLIYGYIGGIIVEAFLTKEITKDVLPILDEEE